MSDDWWATPAGVQTILREEIKIKDDRIEELEAKLAKAVGQMQRVKDYRYDPNIGIELNRLEEALAELKGGKGE